MTKNYILIIWGSAKKYTNDIEKKINKRFQIYKSFNLGWSQDLFNNNLARFYYQNRINAKLKEVECSKSNFLVYVIHDNNPKFKTITLRSIKTLVNINIFNLKQELRNLTGGGHKIHASNNDEEFKKDYQKYKERKGQFKVYK